MNVEAVIRRLEAADEPSIELDEEIRVAVGAESVNYGAGEGLMSDAECYGPAAYTSSLDAAIPGEDIIGTSEQRQRGDEPVKWVAVHRMPKGRMTVSAMARTEALARRAVALKARVANT